MYTDTDSLLLEIETDDVYKDIGTNKNLYDTSDIEFIYILIYRFSQA